MDNSVRQGEVINWLTVVTAVFLPLTFATGHFAMNFRLITQFHGGVSFALWAVVFPSLLGASTSAAALSPTPPGHPPDSSPESACCH
jgi:Mg2+ and Co2+ transporter CorA